MRRLQRHLEREGYTVVNLNYPSTEHRIEYLADEVLAGVLQVCCRSVPVHFVTHSLGGIVVRYYLEDHRLANLGRVVMLSPSNQGSEVVDALKDNLFFKRLNGPAGAQLGTGPESIPARLGPVVFELGVIAGTKSINRRFSRMIPGPSDGKVAVARARVEGMKDFLVLPYNHTFVMRQPEVMRQVIYFLRYGVFDRSFVAVESSYTRLE
jgi:pimeloyl-ACP methyl ester carboxylesterase